VFHTDEGVETLSFEIDRGAIVIYSVRNPDKVRHLSKN
jgi:hypothetical protein